MRHAVLYSVLIAALSALGGCSGTERVNATPPQVSYRISGSDVTQANLDASRYCQRYGTGAEYMGIEQTPSGNVAMYSCAGPEATQGSSDPDAAATAPPTGECANFLHQNRPGGSDYAGPPAAGCAATP